MSIGFFRRPCRNRRRSGLIVSDRTIVPVHRRRYLGCGATVSNSSSVVRQPSIRRTAMKYAILIRESDQDFANRTNPATAESHLAGWTAYTQALLQAGIMTGGAGLMPPATATVLRMRGDKREVQDGPFPEGKEQLGGFYLIDVADLDAALEWAARMP